MLLPEKHLSPHNLLSLNIFISFSSQYFLKLCDNPVDLTFYSSIDDVWDQ